MMTEVSITTILALLKSNHEHTNQFDFEPQIHTGKLLERQRHNKSNLRSNLTMLQQPCNQLMKEPHPMRFLPCIRLPGLLTGREKFI